LLPRFIATYLLTYWLSLGKVIPPITAVHKMLAAFHVSAALAKAVFRPFGRPFQVTAKGLARDRVVVQWPILRIFLMFGVALMAGMAMNLTGYHQVVPRNELTPFDVAWGLYTLILLGLCALVCIELPRPVGAPDREVRHGHWRQAATAVLRRVFA
jgi:cellulose synthase (UDP-forming)